MIEPMDINKKQRLVYDVIRANPGCQDNDAELIAAVWRHEGWSDNLSLEENIAIVTRPDTITRRRRELHQMGLIDYSEQSDSEREQAFVNERDAHSSMPVWGNR